MKALPQFLLLAAVLLLTGCRAIGSQQTIQLPDHDLQAAIQVKADATPLDKLNASAIEQTTYTTSYDPAYVKLDYPNGDVPKETGVCSDVVVRAFRSAGIDLQKELHEDMARNFAKYPKKWNAKRPDKNIDHRRVPNLMTWFARQGKELPITKADQDYLPGDVVAWELDSGLVHIGLVSKIKVEGVERFAIAHNIGAGARLEDVLFQWKIIGHYRYF
ncbi:MAG: DUF1287 domain-containing protein [Acidobacteriota bacterium]|nr:DUF1287 domain-containing protein [Acidobacteriota bacterium]